MFNLNKNRITESLAKPAIAVTALLISLVALQLAGPRVEAQVCYDEGGTGRPPISCDGADSLEQGKCYVKINTTGEEYTYEEVGCPAGATSAGVGEFDPRYVGKTKAECQELANIVFAENMSDEQKAPIQREANTKMNVCLSTISKDLGACQPGDTGEDCIKTVPIFERFITIVNFLAAGVGLYITTMIVFRGVQYSISRNNPQMVAEAKNGIINAVIALLAYIFMYAFLQWLIPGGMF